MGDLSRRALLQGAAAGLALAAQPAHARQSSTATSATGGLNDPDLHVLVDDHEVLRSENLARTVNHPRKHPAPVLAADRPWEGMRAQAWGSVIQEPDGLLRLWYFAFNASRRPGELDRGGYAYAESRDGLHWRKPALGVVEFRGSKKNNLFHTFAPDGKNLVDEELARRGLGLPALDENGKQIGILNNADGLTIVRDDADPDPQKRYKLIANMQDHRMWAPYYPERYPNLSPAQLAEARAVFGQYMDTSPDGIHWTRKPRRILPAVGDYMMVMRDHRHRRWWLNERARGRGGRNAALRTSADLVHWSAPEIIFDNEALADGSRPFEWHGGMTPFNYGDLDLGFLEKWPNAGLGATCELISHRDGQPWRRVAPGTPFLDTGPEGAFDRALIFPTHNAPIRLGEQLLIFYTGGGARQKADAAMTMSIGLATIGVDRFAGMAHWRGPAPGRLVTRPFELQHPHVELNAEILEGEPVKVAVAAPDGMVFPGFGFEECRPEPRKESLYTPVRWRERASLEELRGKSIALQFQFRGAVLYSYRFSAEADRTRR